MCCNIFREFRYTKQGYFEIWRPMLHLLFDKMERKAPTVIENLFSADSEKADLHLIIFYR